MKKCTLMLVAVACGLLAVWVFAPTADANERTTTCTRTLVKGVLHLCGPAKGTLSHWPGFTFTHGTCPSIQKGPDAEFTLELGGIDASKPKTNGGLDYLKIQIFGPFAAPTSGSIIAWHNGKRWSGYGESLRRTRTGWSFVASRYASGAGRFTGTFVCGSGR
jgi:hypothetical protein